MVVFGDDRNLKQKLVLVCRNKWNPGSEIWECISSFVSATLDLMLCELAAKL